MIAVFFPTADDVANESVDEHRGEPVDRRQHGVASQKVPLVSAGGACLASVLQTSSTHGIAALKLASAHCSLVYLRQRFTRSVMGVSALIDRSNQG